MVHDNETEIHRLYEQYKLQWMIYHGFGLSDLIDCMEVMICEDFTNSETQTKLRDLFQAWEYDVGFPGGQIWPCFDEYLVSEYIANPETSYLLISVCERNIRTEIYSSLNAARAAMVAELKDEYLKAGTEAKWDEIAVQNKCEFDRFGFGQLAAWSNLDDDCNCDWQIVPIPPVIT